MKEPQESPGFKGVLFGGFQYLNVLKVFQKALGTFVTPGGKSLRNSLGQLVNKTLRKRQLL